MTEVRAVKIAGLQTDRPWPDDEGIKELAANIRRQGVQEPILVIGREDYILDGVRRVAAMRSLGRENIPAIVSDDMFDVAIRMYETHQTGDLIPARQVEVIRHTHALMGNRTVQRSVADRLDMYVEEHNKQNETSTVMRQVGATRTLLVMAVRGATPYTKIQNLIPIIKAADSGDSFARELVANYEAAEIGLGAIGSAWRERNSPPGEVLKANEQREILTQAALSISSAVYALQKLGTVHPSITTKELDSFIKNLYDPRAGLTCVMNKLRKELVNRYDQAS